MSFFVKKVTSLVMAMGLITQFGLTPLSAYGANASFGQPLDELSQKELKQIERIEKNNEDKFVPVKKCPLFATKHSDLLSKIQTVEKLFKRKCQSQLEIENKEIDQATSAITKSQSDLNKLSGSNSGTQINGDAISGLMKKINSAFVSNQCVEVDKNFLEKIADLVSNVSQMGLLIPSTNGLIVSAGGTVVSSLLYTISSFFKKKYKFKKAADRTTFIKINCAFYDVRKEMYQAGIFEDILTDEEKLDLSTINTILESVKSKNEKNKAINEAKIVSMTNLQERKNSKTVPKLKKVNEIIASLSEFSKEISPAGKTVNRPDAIYVSNMVFNIISKKEIMVAQYEAFSGLKTSNISFISENFKIELEKFDAIKGDQNFIEATMSMTSEDLHGPKGLQKLSFSLNYILRVLEDKKVELMKEKAKTKLAKSLTLKEIIDVIAKEELAVKKEMAGKLAKIIKIKAVLDIRNKSEDLASSFDQGTYIVDQITETYNEIIIQVYGKNSHDFIDTVTEKAVKSQTAFNELFENLQKDNFEKVGNRYIIKDPRKRDTSEIREACADSMLTLKSRTEFHTATHQAYDFVATNRDLFHSNVNTSMFKYIMEQISEVFGSDKYVNEYKKLRKASYSADLAMLKRNKQKYNKADYHDYVTDDSDSIGHLLEDLKKSDKEVKEVKKMRKQYRCSSESDQDYSSHKTFL
jgi:hypothetical protein